MDYIKEYKSFLTSYHLNDGVRKTIGILLPALLFGHYNHLSIGLSISLGAMYVSITDNPGPIHHRRNGFMICNALIFVMALLTGFLHEYHILFTVLLAVFCFVFSMIGVYGARATSVGIAALLTVILEMRYNYNGIDILYNSLYLLAGGVWYMLLSLLLYSIRPYKLTQQVIGDYLMATADYIRAKGLMYSNDLAADKKFEQLLRKQTIAQEKQNLAAELIFKTRDIVRESTNTGRIIMMIYLDVTDLFERAMTSHQDYEKLHQYFDETTVLDEYKRLIELLADDLDNTGIAVKSGFASTFDENVYDEIQKERERLKALREKMLNAENVEGFISLRHILDSIEDIATRTRTINEYTSFDKKISKRKTKAPNPEDFISHQSLDPNLLIDNLTFKSNIFRHSLRVTLAAMSAYIIASIIAINHGYWILLTVIIILKPAYSLTKQRNAERLMGTFVGVALSALLLYFVQNETVIVIVLAVGMVTAYSFTTKNYIVSVIMLTLYVMLMFHLLDSKDFKRLLEERVIDTCIASAIAVVFSFIIPPIWEYQQINKMMVQLLKDNITYFSLTGSVFTGNESNKEKSRVARKNSWVALANLSDTFNRMLSEPKRQQKNIQQLHRFVVSSHMLTSHIATLSYYTDNLKQEYIMNDYQPLITLPVQNLNDAVHILEGHETVIPANIETDDPEVHLLEKRVNILLHTRREELKKGQLETDTKKTLSEFKSIADQFYFIYNVSKDIHKISGEIKL